MKSAAKFRRGRPAKSAPGRAPWRFALFIAAGLTACSDKAGTERSGPELVALDSIVLRESPDSFIGEPLGLDVGPAGNLLVGDNRSHYVHVYDRDGALVRRLGRPGPGPSEFTMGPQALVANDSVLVAEAGPQVSALDLRTGEGLWTRRVPSTAFPPATPLASRDGWFYFLLVDRENRSILARFRSGEDSLDRGGPYPGWIGKSNLLDQVFTHMAVAALPGDSVALVNQVADTLYVGPYRGPFAEIPIAVKHRRGARPELLAQVSDADPQGAADFVYELSIPWDVHRLSSGEFAYIAADLQRHESHFGAKLYLSVIDPAGRRTCPDAELPVPTDPMAQAAFVGDTLLLLHQAIEDSTPRTIVRRYLISTDGCDWRTTA